MKKAFLIVAALLLAACSKVPAGNVGIKVNLLGGEKGVDIEELVPGRYWIGVNEELYLFPTFTQNTVWDATEANGGDESLTFQTVEGMNVNADVGMSYAIDPSRATDIFQKYRKGIDEITDLYLRNMVRDALNKSGSTREIETVYGAGKADLIAEVENAVREQVKPLGINVERIYWVNSLRLPANVTTALNAKIAATQKAQQRENEVAQSKAEAQKQIEEARGVAEATLLQANATAQAIRIRGEALRENQRLIELTIAERWDGKLPQITGGAMPLINMPSAGK
jgi:regulator of protease activity HflC (stomatin/prohibitin superfamily)